MVFFISNSNGQYLDTKNQSGEYNAKDNSTFVV